MACAAPLTLQNLGRIILGKRCRVLLGGLREERKHDLTPWCLSINLADSMSVLLILRPLVHFYVLPRA
jgi:hypothetical protein